MVFCGKLHRCVEEFAPRARSDRRLTEMKWCIRERQARRVTPRVDCASVFVGLNSVRIHGFAADPTHLGGSYEKHRGGLFTP
jgi:hypothetical protein